jgi:hypothetical protein
MVVVRAPLVARASWQTDDVKDLTLIDVEMGPLGEESWPHQMESGHNFSSFNHFIDIKDGPGEFDDFDGYSYRNGSAHTDEFERAEEETTGSMATVFATLSGFKVDEGLMGYWYNDEYVARDSNRSPCLEAYSFPKEMGLYAENKAELKKRFPLAHCVGGDGLGVPYSVFMPVDNLARYWYERFLSSHDVRALGPVLHAIQDASVPHHAAGYLGNYHSSYENFLDRLLRPSAKDLEADPTLKARDPVPDATSLFNIWCQTDSDPPGSLHQGDENRTPALNWRIDHLVTWMALHAYRVYSDTFRHFRAFGGDIIPSCLDMFRRSEEEIWQLVTRATAMSALVLEKAQREGHLRFLANEESRRVHASDCAVDFGSGPKFDTLEAATAEGYHICSRCLKPARDELLEGDKDGNDYLGNYDTLELHESSCAHVRWLKHKTPFHTIEEALDRGYNGCHWCLTAYDLDNYDGSYVPRGRS